MAVKNKSLLLCDLINIFFSSLVSLHLISLESTSQMFSNGTECMEMIYGNDLRDCKLHL